MDITKTDLFNNVYIKSWTWGRLSEAVVDIAYMSFLYGLGYKCGFVDWRKSYDE